MIETGLTIESPEGASFQYELASLSDRAKAYAFDLLIRGAVVLAVSLLFALILGSAIMAGVGIWLIIYFSITWGYYILFETIWSGQSIGKKIFGLRVVKVAGHPIRFMDSVLRNLLRAADVLPVPLLNGVGAFTMLFSRRFQRLGDIAAGTVVIVERRSLYRGAHGMSVLPSPSRLRLSNKERKLIADFAARKDRLHPERAEEIASILAIPLSRRLGLAIKGSSTLFLMELYYDGKAPPMPQGSYYGAYQQMTPNYAMPPQGPMNQGPMNQGGEQ